MSYSYGKLKGYKGVGVVGLHNATDLKGIQRATQGHVSIPGVVGRHVSIPTGA